MSKFYEQIRQRIPWLLGISVSVLLLDQLTKWWIFNNVAPRQSIPVIDGFFHIVHVHNTGAAFGFLSGWNRVSTFLTFVSLIFISCILIYYFLMPLGNRLILVALSLVLGGAIGNVIDRFRLGFVIDFVDWHYKDVYHWPAFNLADTSITIAMGLILIDLVRDFKRHRFSSTLVEK